jgi:hypothetical protein
MPYEQALALLETSRHLSTSDPERSRRIARAHEILRQTGAVVLNGDSG